MVRLWLLGAHAVCGPQGNVSSPSKNTFRRLLLNYVVGVILSDRLTQVKMGLSSNASAVSGIRLGGSASRSSGSELSGNALHQLTSYIKNFLEVHKARQR